MMESVDFFDKHLDPPDDPTRGQCDICGDDFDEDDLVRIGTPGNYRWLCINCLDEIDNMNLEETE